MPLCWVLAFAFLAFSLFLYVSAKLAYREAARRRGRAYNRQRDWCVMIFTRRFGFSLFSASVLVVHRPSRTARSRFSRKTFDGSSPFGLRTQIQKKNQTHTHTRTLCVCVLCVLYTDRTLSKKPILCNRTLGVCPATRYKSESQATYLWTTSPRLGRARRIDKYIYIVYTNRRFTWSKTECGETRNKIHTHTYRHSYTLPYRSKVVRVCNASAISYKYI